VFLLCREHDPCSLYLGAMITGMGIFIGCGYVSHTGIDVVTLVYNATSIPLIRVNLGSIFGWGLIFILKAL
jgi:hypothetical protein